MRDLHVPPIQLADQLHIVVSGNTQSRAGLDHAHRQPENGDDLRPTVHQIPQEDHLAPLRVGYLEPIIPFLRLFLLHLVTQFAEECPEFVVTAVDIPDDRERPMFVPPVVPERLPLDLRLLDRRQAVQGVDGAKTFLGQVPQTAPHLLVLQPDHVRSKAPVRARFVPLAADLLGQIEDDRHWQAMVLSRQLHQGPACIGLHVGGVDDGQSPRRKAFGRDELQHLKGGSRGGLVVLIVRHQPAAEIGGDHLGGQEMLPGKGGLPGTRRADQNDQRHLGDGELHRVNTPICVGAPSSGSSSPMPKYLTW